MPDGKTDDAVTEVAGKLAEIADTILCSGHFEPGDVAIAFLTVGAWVAIADIGEAATVETFRRYADQVETQILRQRPN